MIKDGIINCFSIINQYFSKTPQISHLPFSSFLLSLPNSRLSLPIFIAYQQGFWQSIFNALLFFTTTICSSSFSFLASITFCTIFHYSPPSSELFFPSNFARSQIKYANDDSNQVIVICSITSSAASIISHFRSFTCKWQRDVEHGPFDANIIMLLNIYARLLLEWGAITNIIIISNNIINNIFICIFVSLLLLFFR